MNNARKLLIGVVTSLVLALTLATVVYKKLELEHDEAVRSQHLYRYVAAARAIAPGERIGSGDLMMVTWSSDQPVDSAFMKESDVSGRVAVYPIPEGMIVSDKSLAGPGSTLGLPTKIPSGMRAIAIRTDEVSDLGGFVFPGAHVDVLATLHAPMPAGDETVTVLTDAEVLATGKQMVPNPDGKPEAVQVVTLLVTPEQAQKVALAQQQGAIHLALRNGSDQAMTDMKPTEISDLGLAPPIPSNRGRRRVVPERVSSSPTVVEAVLGEKHFELRFSNNSPAGGNAGTARGQKPQ
jgi:pilus assembly protein CpaB